MPREVSSTSDAPGRGSTPSPVSSFAIGMWLICIRYQKLSTQQHRQLIESAADASGANREDRVARPSFAQQIFDGALHRAREHDVLVSRGRNSLRQLFGGDALAGRLAS